MPKLDLLLLESDDPERPFSPIAHVYVSEHGKHDYKGHENKILISAQCMTPREIDEAVDGLIEDLERIRKQAKAGFARHRSKFSK